MKNQFIFGGFNWLPTFTACFLLLSNFPSFSKLHTLFVFCLVFAQAHTPLPKIILRVMARVFFTLNFIFLAPTQRWKWKCIQSYGRRTHRQRRCRCVPAELCCHKNCFVLCDFKVTSMYIVISWFHTYFLFLILYKFMMNCWPFLHSSSLIWKFDLFCLKLNQSEHAERIFRAITKFKRKISSLLSHLELWRYMNRW